MGAGESITIRTVVERHELERGARLASRASTERARSRRPALAMSALLVVLTVVVVTTSGAGVWLLVLVVPAFMVAASSHRLFAWMLSRAMWTSLQPTPYLDIRADAHGVESVHGGVTVRIDWVAVTGVAETPDETVFVADKGRTLSCVIVGARWVTPEQRATLHRWAREAPGERRWLSVGDPERSRIRIAGTSGNSVG